MKKGLLTLILSMGMLAPLLAQADKIYKHSGEIIEGSVIRMAEYTVVLKYANEDAEQIIGKYAIEKIIYGKTGRVEKVSEKIILNGKADWEKVVILEDKVGISGLNKVGSIKGKTSFINYHFGASGDEKAERRLKEAAAINGCAFILLVSERSIKTFNNIIGGSQELKRGIAYCY